ncbi:MAG: serine/threonine protein kinase [Leptolyngbyaceae cyanobacterium SM2_5_2]|nr:serine/threonine protein kinase [Leptolyngbyaceae cyanobacterium SM2_5_2]
MDVLIGRTVHNRYQIQSLLSRQIGRRTFLATDLNTGSSVVVKLLLFGPDFIWDNLKLFEREAKILKHLDHPAIPAYLDYFDVDTELGKGFALIQSYIDATSLEASVQSGRTFSEAELVEIAEQLLAILVYLHEQSPPVIHRDIKPSNVLITNRTGHHVGDIYLVDFGSVQTVVHGGTVTIVGTYGYMPPEQFGGRTTPASDLYSLGATLIYLLTGIHPADLPKRRGILQFDAAIHISQACQAWLQRMIQPEVEERFATAQQALEALQQEDFLFEAAQSIPTKPKGSRVILHKTEDQLQIVISALTVRDRLKVIQKAILYTVLINSPILAFLAIFIHNPSLIWLLVPLLGGGVFRVWESALCTCFEEVQVLISDRQIIYLTSSWLGRDHSYSALIKEITRLESSNIEGSYNPKFEITHLNIWIGNHCCPLSSPKSLDNLRQLTRPEVDWLSFELGEWLDMPVQKLSVDRQKNNLSHQERSTILFPGQAKREEKNSQDNLIQKLNLTQVQRPENAKFTIYKTAEAIEISPHTRSLEAGSSSGLAALLLTIPYFVLAIAFALSNPLLVLPLGALPLILWKITKYLFELVDLNKVLLIANQQDVLVVKQRGQDQESRKCLRKVPIDLIQSIQIVHHSSAVIHYRYHVKLKINRSNFNPGYADILVGNRTCWLSRQEAFWLSSELSNWLKLPVTEMEVVVGS